MNTRITFDKQSLKGCQLTDKINNIFLIINQVIFQIDEFDAL